MALHKLKPREIQFADVGDLDDGGGLRLRVRERGSSWLIRYTAPDGARRSMGLGKAMRDTLPVAGQSLVNARTAAARVRAQLAEGVDPVAHKQAARAESKARDDAAKNSVRAERMTLARHARAYHECTVEPRLTAKHSAQWIASLEQGVPPAIWHKPIADVTQAELLEALAILQLRVPETASRVRQRLDAVFDDAQFHNLCTSNPARIVKRKLAERPRGKVKGNFKSLPSTDVPAFVKSLREQPGVAARALELALLCASRTSEVLGCQWCEIDAQAGIWCVPGARMKCGEPHTVHLSVRALEIIKAAREYQGSPWVFPSPTDREKPMSNMAMLALIGRMGVAKKTTVHGLCRASFSTWAYDGAHARGDVIEAALAHRESDKVKAAYNRAAFHAERKALLALWARYCNGEQVHAVEQRPSATVHQIAAAA